MNKDRFFEIVDQIQERNKDKDPDEVYRDVTDAVEEVRQKLYGQGVVAATEGIFKGQQPAKTAEELREAAENAIADETEERSS